MSELQLLAFDIGASNGRSMLGRFDGERMALTELTRFENGFTADGALAHWNIDRLLGNMKIAFQKAYGAGALIDCFGIDTWGADYGLLDAGGKLIADPRAYRCSRDADMQAAWKLVPRDEIFRRTGIASLNFNTVFQLYRRVREHDGQLAQAARLLLIPDLLGYMLTGEAATEYTNATTTGLLDPATKDWDWDTIQALGIPERLFTRIDLAGTRRGKLKTDMARELGVPPCAYAAVGTHDTASAVAAIPGSGSFAFCSSGTWSLFGVETQEPVRSQTVFKANFSNEGTVQGAFRPLKNIMGLWLVQECRREWLAAGQQLGWDDIVALAKTEAPFRSLIDPDDAPFFFAGDMQGKIIRYCEATDQPTPETVGQFARCIYESLALKYRAALETLEDIKGARIDSLNIVGGGIQNKLLNQFAANAAERLVITGPAEGACAGNLLLQAQALGGIHGISEAREVVRRSFSLSEYEPHDTGLWRNAYGRLLEIMHKKKEKSI